MGAFALLGRLGDVGLFAPPLIVLVGLALAQADQVMLAPCVVLLLAMSVGPAEPGRILRSEWPPVLALALCNLILTPIIVHVIALGLGEAGGGLVLMAAGGAALVASLLRLPVRPRLLAQLLCFFALPVPSANAGAASGAPGMCSGRVHRHPGLAPSLGRLRRRADPGRGAGHHRLAPASLAGWEEPDRGGGRGDRRTHPQCRRRARRCDGEILSQSNEFTSHFMGVLCATPGSHLATLAMMEAASLIAGLTVQHFKMIEDRHRPSQVCAALRPPIEVPGHASCPSGHATQSYLIAL